MTLSQNGRPSPLDELYEYAKNKGTITYQEVTDRLGNTFFEADQLEKVLDKLHQVYGIDISDKALRTAVEKHNDLCRTITEIGDFRKLDNPPITGYEFHVIQLVSQVCPHDLILPYLKETLEELRTRQPEPKFPFRARVVLAGSEIDDPEFTKLLEMCGAMVVADRYCFGSFPSREEIEIRDGETAYDAICRHYLHWNQCARFMDGGKIDQRHDELERLVKEYHADGIIYESMKFCEFWSYEKVLASHILSAERGIPCCTIEKEYTLGSVGQLRTRFQAFVESLEIKKIENELSDLSGKIADWTAILNDDSRVLAIVKNELTALKEKGVGLEMRMDMDEGMLYMTFTGEALEALGLPADTWYSMDMGALFEQLGMDYAELMDLSKTMDASAMLETMLQSADLSDKDTAYATVAGLVDSAAKLDENILQAVTALHAASGVGDYNQLEDQVRTIRAFDRPVILVDDMLHDGKRIRRLAPLLAETNTPVDQVLVGYLTGMGRDLMEQLGYDVDAIYYLPNLRLRFVESTLYPFIGGDTVRRSEGLPGGLQPAVNRILPYAAPEYTGMDDETAWELSLCCLENARDILLALETEFRSLYARNLTLSRLGEAVILPLCPDKGGCMTYDLSRAASTYLEGDIELLKRMRPAR